MKFRNLLAAIFVVIMTAICYRLGFWQISRLHEKQALNRAQRRALASVPLVVTDPDTPAAPLRDHRVVVSGTFDEHHQVLLAGHVLDGAPGVGVVTPLVLADRRHAVLVERGWLYADDAATAHPERFPEPGVRHVIGIAAPLLAGRGGTPYITVPSDSATLWSARWLDRDSLAARLPYALATFVVRELPGPGVPERPRRSPPRTYDESMHVNYAIQWFAFGTILLVGSLIMATRKRRPGATVVPPMPGR